MEFKIFETYTYAKLDIQSQKFFKIFVKFRELTSRFRKYPCQIFLQFSQNPLNSHKLTQSFHKIFS